ncbi:hypothetical protein Tco_0852838, partial [Tanacetum coccineum]
QDSREGWGLGVVVSPEGCVGLRVSQPHEVRRVAAGAVGAAEVVIIVDVSKFKAKWQLASIIIRNMGAKLKVALMSGNAEVVITRLTGFKSGMKVRRGVWDMIGVFGAVIFVRPWAQAHFRRTSLTGFPAQSVRSSNAAALDSPYLLVLDTGTSQSKQHDMSESEGYYLSD